MLTFIPPSLQIFLYVSLTKRRLSHNLLKSHADRPSHKRTVAPAGSTPQPRDRISSSSQVLSSCSSSSLCRTAMEGSAISEASLKAAITERLNAVHVEITDMSGSCSKWPILNTRCPPPLRQSLILNTPCSPPGQGYKSASAVITNNETHICRRVWPGIFDTDRITRVRREELTEEASRGQRGTEGGDRCHPRLDCQVPNA